MRRWRKSINSAGSCRCGRRNGWRICKLWPATKCSKSSSPFASNIRSRRMRCSMWPPSPCSNTKPNHNPEGAEIKPSASFSFQPNNERKINMAHNLLIQNGQASMFYIDEVPWHGLGVKLNGPATAQEAITAAQLDWKVVKLPLFAGSKRLPVPDRFAVVRRTGDLIQRTDPVLGVVSNEYTPLQNRQAFQFFDPIVGQNAAIFHTAGALGNGERVWILAKLPGHIRVAGDDLTEKYLLLSNSHDGKSSVTIKFTPVRVVCQNTLTLALNEGNVYRVIHHADIQQTLKQTHEMLGL